MRFRRPRRPDLEWADRMLDEPSSTADGDRVARLLAAAAAPPRPGELAGEEAAVAAFRAVRAAAPGPVGTTTRAWGRSRVGAAVWGVLATVTVTTGVAVAAGTQFRDDPPAPPPVTAPAPTSTNPAPASTTPGGSPERSGQPGEPTVPGPNGPRVPASTRGLCQAFLARKAAERDRSTRTPASRRLVEVAGGPDRVEPFCRRLLQDAPAPGQNPTAGPPGPLASPGPPASPAKPEPSSKKSRGPDATRAVPARSAARN